MVQSLDRAMDILSILEKENSASVTEIAAKLEVNKSTASRLLETLKQHEMVRVASSAISTSSPLRVRSWQSCTMN